MIFGGTHEGDGGYGVPVDLVLAAAAGRLHAVGSGPCIVR
jgi:hypothetical protein